MDNPTPQTFSPLNVDQAIRKGLTKELQRDQEVAAQYPDLAEALKDRIGQAVGEIYDGITAEVTAAKQPRRPLAPLDRKVIVRLAAQEAVSADELIEDDKLQVEEFLVVGAKSKSQIGEAIGRDGQSLAALVKSMVADQRIVKDGDRYELPASKDAE